MKSLLPAVCDGAPFKTLRSHLLMVINTGIFGLPMAN